MRLGLKLQGSQTDSPPLPTVLASSLLTWQWRDCEWCHRYEGLKRRLKMIVRCWKKPDAASKLGLEPCRGLLLFGPHGCGKTFYARLIASECNANLLSLSGQVHTPAPACLITRSLIHVMATEQTCFPSTWVKVKDWSASSLPKRVKSSRVSSFSTRLAASQASDRTCN
jgi:hypothetical protein